MGIDDARYILGGLDKVIYGYDCIIMDHAYSTAFAIVAASTFFDLILDIRFFIKGLSHDGRAAVLDRVQLIKNQSSAKKWTVDVDLKIDHSFSHNTEKYCRWTIQY